MLKAIKIRIYPNNDQQQLLAKQFGGVRYIYNYMLDKKNAAYKEGVKLSVYDLKKLLPVLKREEKTIWLKEIDSQSLQEALFHMDRAFQNFFNKRSSFPKFKNKHGKQSIWYPQRVTMVDNKVYLPKVGLVKANVHREINGKIKTVTVSKTVTNKYYAAILVEDNKVTKQSNNQKVIGIDIGINSIIATSDGEKIENPRLLKKATRNILRKQRKLSRKQKSSNRRKKAKLLLAKAHERLSDIRNDWQHKLSKKIADENQVVIIEDLSVKNMIKNHKLARHIGDASWQSLIQKISYKLEANGGRLIRVDRFYPSTKTCSCCKNIKEKISLSDRVYKCEACGYVEDRDINASKNIYHEGMKILNMAEGQSVTARGGKRKTKVALNNVTDAAA